MTTVAARELRNHTAQVLRQVSDGTQVTITVNGRPVAELRPVGTARPQFFSRSDLIRLTTLNQADPGLMRDLQTLAGETTDDLEPL